MSQKASVPPFVNRGMKFLLRSPLHALVSKSILLITFRGRRSGREYTTPVSYSQEGSRVSIFTHAEWWRNLEGGAPVTLRLRGRDVRGLAQPVETDMAAIAAGLAQHLRKVRSDATFYGVTFDEQGSPRPEEIQKAVQSVVMVNVQL